MNLLTAVGNHLWQSTLFAAAAGLATLACRRSGAAARHALWLTQVRRFIIVAFPMPRAPERDPRRRPVPRG